MQTRVEDQNAAVESSPRRRWMGIVIAVVVVLALYAGALLWVNQRLQTDIQKSIHTLPVDNQDHPAGQ